MKLHGKKLVSILFAVTLLAGVVTGCGNSGSSAGYIDALMGVTYFSDAIDNKLLDMSDEEVSKAKEQCATKEAEFLQAYFNMEEVSDETKDAFEQVAQKLGQATDYSVEGEGDKVTVTIKPLKVYSEELQEYVDEFNVKKYVDADKSCTEKEYVDNVVKILEKSADNPQYGEEVKIEVTVSEDGGEFTVSDEDLAKIDNAMFIY